MLSEQQNAVLTAFDQRRLTVVRAGPGSGKTRVFVETLRRQLGTWTSNRAGIAALSFTNVAHEVITQRLGGAPSAPHFIGTIDAFLLRFVVQPFATILGFCPQGARLLPEKVARTLDFPNVSFGPKPYQKASIFDVSWRGGTESAPVAFARDRKGRPLPPDPGFSTEVLSKKRQEWRKRGRLTHSDSNYLSSVILHEEATKAVAALVASRFPVILLDEFQDTNWFLGRAMLQLLAKVSKGLIVGDPDQAIFQFAGADRELFSKADALAGAPSLLLDESHRCAQRVSAVATSLSRSGKQVRPRNDAPSGDALLVVYEGDHPDAGAIIEKLQARLPVEQAGLMVLSRRELKKAKAESDPWDGVSKQICKAIGELRDGDARTAAKLLSRQLSECLLDVSTPSETDFENAGIDPKDWARSIARVLFSAERVVQGETWNDWIDRVKAELRCFTEHFGLDFTSLSRSLRRNTVDGAAPRPTYDPRGDVVGLDLQTPSLTVHKAKGREFETVVVLVAKPNKATAPCPSSSWWDPSLETEEREVAYVAASRAQRCLCIAVHRRTYEALQRDRPSFVALFDLLDAE